MSVTLTADDEPIPGLDAAGKPEPAYAAALGLRPASSARRAAAFTLDAAIWAVLALPSIIGFIALARSIAAVGGDTAALQLADSVGVLIAIAIGQTLTAIFGLVQLILHGRRGITVGKAAAGLRSVSVRDFGPPGFWRIVVRALVLFGMQVVLPIVGPALFFLSYKSDAEKRGRSWLDRIGRCYVVDARRGVDPFDAKALRRAHRAAQATPAEVSAALPSLASSNAPAGVFFVPAGRSSSGVVSAGSGPFDPNDWAAPSAAPVTRVPVPAAPVIPAPVVPAPVSVQALPVYVLVFDDGARVVASVRGLIGRAPAANPANAHAQLLALPDPAKRLSKTHASFDIDAFGFSVTDLGSTNGTEVTPPNGTPADLQPQVATIIPVGACVTLGGRSFIVTTQPGVTAT